MTDLQVTQGTAAEYWQQKLVANPQRAAVPLVTQDVISAPSSQAFIGRLFLVCGLLTKDTHNRMEKSLSVRAWLNMNFDELNDMLQSVDWLYLITSVTDNVWATGFGVL